MDLKHVPDHVMGVSHELVLFRAYGDGRRSLHDWIRLHLIYPLSSMSCLWWHCRALHRARASAHPCLCVDISVTNRRFDHVLDYLLSSQKKADFCCDRVAEITSDLSQSSKSVIIKHNCLRGEWSDQDNFRERYKKCTKANLIVDDRDDD